MEVSHVTGPARPSQRKRSSAFGTVEPLPSGRFRVRWRDEGGRRVTAPHTFATKSDARRYLSTVEADRIRGTLGARRQVVDDLSSYGSAWIEGRPHIKDSTRHQYEIDFRRHIEPSLGNLRLSEIDAETVRRWHADQSRRLQSELAKSGRSGAATVARAYRLLRSILQTAVDDEVLSRNPCRIVGGGDARSAERPVLSAEEIGRLAEAVPGRYRAFVLVAGFTGLRAGELAALRVADLNLRASTPSITVSRRFYRVGGAVTVDAPKSLLGSRAVALPAFVARELRAHLKLYRAGAAQTDLVFVTTGGRDVIDGYSQVLRRGLNRIGRTDARAHDLRHSALTSAAEHGATLATLMQMAGHSTPAAAQRYQHATLEHARRVAEAMDKSASGAVSRTKGKASAEGSLGRS